MPNGNIFFPADASGVLKLLFEIQPGCRSGRAVVWSIALLSSMTGSTCAMFTATVVKGMLPITNPASVYR